MTEKPILEIKHVESMSNAMVHAWQQKLIYGEVQVVHDVESHIIRVISLGGEKEFEYDPELIFKTFMRSYKEFERKLKEKENQDGEKKKI